jgi:hypothetical protein
MGAIRDVKGRAGIKKGKLVKETSLKQRSEVYGDLS